MGCLSLGWIEGLLIDLVCIAAVIMIIQVIVPWVMGLLGGQFAIIGQVLNIVLWAVVAIFCIYIVFGLLSCLLGGASFHLLR